MMSTPSSHTSKHPDKNETFVDDSSSDSDYAFDYEFGKYRYDEQPCYMLGPPSEHRETKDVIFVQSPDDPPKPSTSRHFVEQCVYRDDNDYVDGYVDFYKRATSKLCRASIMLVGYVNSGKSSLKDYLLE